MSFRLATARDIAAPLGFWATAGEDSDHPVDTADVVDRRFQRDVEALTLVIDGDAIVGTLVAGRARLASIAGTRADASWSMPTSRLITSGRAPGTRVRLTGLDAS